MALAETGLDFSVEEFDVAGEFSPGCWVIGSKHNAGLIDGFELNNRTFVFKLTDRSGADVLMVFGCGNAGTVGAVQDLVKQTGLKVAWILSNGGAHHLFLRLWYQAFPDARVLVPSKRIPYTRNGEKLAVEFAERWELVDGPRPAPLIEEFGDQIDVVIFDQLFGYKDETAAEAFDGEGLDHTSKKVKMNGFKLLMRFGKLQGDQSQPTDEVFFFHKGSGLAIGGHNFQFSYMPKTHTSESRHVLKNGPFPMNLMLRFMNPAGVFKSTLESQPQPIADPEEHIARWEAVLAWDMKAWTSCHDPVRICGPDMSGDEIKNAIRESLARSGEDDPTGARLTWNIKNKK